MKTTANEVIDARGLRCPIPVIRLAQSAARLNAGARITVLTTDPAAQVDIPAWVRMRKHILIEQVPLPGHLSTTVVLAHPAE